MESRGHTLPHLVTFPPFISAPVLSLDTATGTMSPAALTGSDMHRSKSKRLARVRELLTPIKDSKSPITPAFPSAPQYPKEMEKDDEGFIKAKPVAVGSGIEFFPRHPADYSAHSLTFLDGSSAAGTGDTMTGTSAEEAAPKETQTITQSGSSSKPYSAAEEVLPMKETQTTTETESSSDPFYSCGSVFSSSIDPDSRSFADRRGSEDRGRSPPRSIPILRAPRKFTGDGRRIPVYSQLGKEKIMRTSPTTLYEMPGRFRGMEPCWYCCDGVDGELCEVCGLVVRRASPERWQAPRGGFDDGEFSSLI
ncbi:MAG: hypothetical protein Q9221_002228 [Calogaya cf. arnoldii]